MSPCDLTEWVVTTGDISVEFVNLPIPLALCQLVYYLWTILGMQHLQWWNMDC